MTLRPRSAGRATALVEQTQATLARLAEAPAAAAAAARAASAELAEAWARAELAVGIGGDLPVRTELVNFLCGDTVLDPFARPLGSPAFRIRRGATTRFHAIRDDGTTAEQPAPVASAGSVGAQVEDARHGLADRETALVRFDQTLPAVIRRRPARWAVWLWPVFWLVSWLSRRRLEARRDHELAVIDARAQLATADRAAAEAARAAQLARRRYLEAVHRLATASDIRELQIEVATGPLPEGVELLELTGPSRASAEVDAVLLVRPDGLYAPGRTAPLHVGELAAAIPALRSLLRDARALGLARRGRDKIDVALAGLDGTLERSEAGFRARLERLGTHHVVDPRGFSEAQLDRVWPQIIASVQAVLEHASVHLGSELSLLQVEWVGSIASTTTPDELKARVARIADAWEAAPRRIADEVRVLVMGGLGGSARDIYPDLVAPLVPRGLPEQHARPLRAAPILAPITLLPSLAADCGTKLELPGLLKGLFRSLDAQRAEVRAKAHERLERLQESSAAELFDAEPRLHAAIGQALAGELATAIAHQEAWLAGALATEHAAIAQDRAALAPLLRTRDDVRLAVGRLTELIAELEGELPAVAIAAAAAATASLSR